MPNETLTGNVTTTPPRGQRRPAAGAEKALVGGLVLVTCTAIGAVLWIVLASGQHTGTVAQAAIGAISAVTVAAIGAITVALQKWRSRPNRS